MSFRGVNTRGIPYRTRRALDRISEYLERPLDEIQPTGESPSIPRTVLRDISRVQHIVSGVVGTVTHLEAPPRDTLLVMRFKATPTLTGGGNLSLRGPFTPLSTGDALVFVSDGQRLYEIARSGGVPLPLSCPLSIESGGTTYWSLDCAAEEVYQKADLIPYVQVSPYLPRQYLGTMGNEWKGVWTWAVSTKGLYIATGNVSVTPPQELAWSPLTAPGQEPTSICRMTTTGNTEIHGIIPQGSYRGGIVLEVINVSNFEIKLMNMSLLASPVNRIRTGTGQDLPLAPHDSSRQYYDNDDDYWRVLK